MGQSDNSSLGQLFKFIRHETKYLDYASTLAKELVKSLEDGDNKRLPALADTNKDFRELLAEKLLAKNFQIKSGDIRVNSKLTLKPLRVKGSELDEIRNAKAGTNKDTTYTLRDVLKQMAAAKDRKARASAVAKYADMNNILEFRFGKAVQDIKAAEHHIQAGTATMPGTTTTPQEAKRAAERRANDSAEQLEALHLAVKNATIMGDFKEMFEESIGSYGVMLLSSELPKSINSVTAPELDATVKREISRLRDLGMNPTEQTDEQIIDKSNDLTKSLRSDKENLSDKLIKAFFGKEGLSTEDLFEARVFAKVASPDINPSERTESLVTLKSEIIEDFLSSKMPTNRDGLIDISDKATQEVFERYIDPILNGTTNHNGDFQTGGPFSVADLRAALNEDDVFANLIDHWSNQTIQYNNFRTSPPGAAQTALNELDAIREKVVEFDYNNTLVNNTSAIDAKVKASLESAIKKGAFQDGVIGSDKFSTILDALESSGHAGKIKSWKSALDSYQSNKSKAATAVLEIYDAMQTAPTGHSAYANGPQDAFKKISDALELKEESVLTEESSFKEDLGSAIATLYEAIANEDPIDDKTGGLTLLQKIIEQDEEEAKRAPVQEKLFKQDKRGYFEYQMTIDNGFDGQDFDPELRVVALGRLIQKIKTSGASEEEQQKAVQYILGNLKENTSNNFDPRVPITLLTESDRILGGNTFDNFHKLQREEARYGYARAAVNAKKSELAGGMLYRMFDRSIKSSSGVFGKLKAALEKIRDIFSGGDTLEAANRLKEDSDPSIVPFKAAYDRAKGNGSDDYAYKSSLKASPEQDQEHIDVFLAALRHVDQRLAQREAPDAQA